MNRDEILHWLHEQDPAQLQILWARADSSRQEHVGDAVHLRGLIEFSNYCRSRCHYCGMRADRRSLERYRMTAPEILASARDAVARGYGAIVMQSGEDPGLDAEWLAQIIETIKRETPLAVTLSCGERLHDELARWRKAGADRYFLRFETSSKTLWKSIHPPLTKDSPHRLEILRGIKELGYETGSGIMVGIPGQTWASLVEDIEWFRRLDLDMIGSGPFIPHGETPLGQTSRRAPQHVISDQVPDTELMTYKVMALTRLACPRANIPTTTALATLNREHGSKLGLERGANVMMVNLTPPRYRAFYEIYPAKACIGELPQDQNHRVSTLLASLGRYAGGGPGTSPNFQLQRSAEARAVTRS